VGDLTTRAKVKGALRMPTGVTVHDTRIDEIIGEIEGELLAQTTLSAWAATTYTEYHDTLGFQDVVLLKRFPVISAVAATLIASSEALTENTDYQVEASGKLSLLEGRLFPSGRRQFVVTYSAGAFTAGNTSAALVRAATLMAARQYNLEPAAGLSEADLRPIRQAIAAWGEDAIQAEIDRTMARYRSALG
jgi:hypothetical protein